MSKKYNIYLDNASTTIPYDFLKKHNIWGNASALYDIGVEAQDYLNKSKKIIGNIFDTKSNNILFTSGATEANNIVIQSILNRIVEEYKNEGSIYYPQVVCSPIEHPSVMNILKHYEQLDLIRIEFLPLDVSGHVIVDNLDKILNSRTCLVTCMYVNNEIGTIQDVRTIGKHCKKRNIPFHVDATQGVGKLNINIQEDNIDYLTFSAHKFHGPKGIGAIVCNSENSFNKLTPLMFGGHQQNGLRPGTENVEDIYYMAKVLGDQMNDVLDFQQLSLEYNLLLEDMFESECFKHNINILINSEDFKIPVFNISFKGVSGDYLVSELNNMCIYVSTGSACTSGELDPSYVLQAIGVPDDYINGTIRISFDPYDDNLANKLKDVVNEIINLLK